MRNREKYLTRKNLSGDELWSEIERSVAQTNLEIKELQHKIENGLTTFKNEYLKQEAIIHPSTKRTGDLQFTYFDELGAVGDIEAVNEKEMAEKIHVFGFVVCDKEDFKNSILADENKIEKKVKKKLKKLIVEIER